MTLVGFQLSTTARRHLIEEGSMNNLEAIEPRGLSC